MYHKKTVKVRAILATTVSLAVCATWLCIMQGMVLEQWPNDTVFVQGLTRKGARLRLSMRSLTKYSIYDDYDYANAGETSFRMRGKQFADKPNYLWMNRKHATKTMTGIDQDVGSTLGSVTNALETTTVSSSRDVHGLDTLSESIPINYIEKQLVLTPVQTTETSIDTSKCGNNTDCLKTLNTTDSNNTSPGQGSFIQVNGIVNVTKRAIRRLPKALIIGVKKCGTRALLEYLRIHPDVRAPGPEPHFFDRYYSLGLDWYREQMPTSIEGQITIEKTPRYFVSEFVPERIYNMSKDTKLIVVVRDPVTRAISDFTQGVSKNHYSKAVTFEMKAFRGNGTGVINSHWSAITTGFYAEHLRRWLRYFPSSHIHLVSGENLISNPSQELDRVQDFLGLKRVITEKHFYYNHTKGFPCLKKYEGSPIAHCFNKKKGRPHISVNDSTLKRLKALFEPYNRDFYQLTGIDFGW